MPDAIPPKRILQPHFGLGDEDTSLREIKSDKLKEANQSEKLLCWR